MALLSLRGVTLSFGGPLLLDGADLHIERGERIAVIGRNGAGKTTFLKLVHGELPPDDGEITRSRVTTALLTQEVPRELLGTVFDVVSSGAASPNGAAWQLEQRVSEVISRMDLDPEAEVGVLSAGLKRRVLLARALAVDPDVLLLDEPTNHLDIASIGWLESFLLRDQRTLVCVTHDRMLLRRLATRIVEIDRGRLADFSCDYTTFLERRQAQLDEEAGHDARLDDKLAREEIWIRQGIKARRTRNEGRVRALEKLRDQRRARRERVGKVRFSMQEAERTGKKVIETKHAGFAYSDGEPVIDALSTVILRGDRVGIIGANGSGKTTLLRLLLGELAPSSGEVRHGTRLEIAYFDQLRAQLDEEKSVIDNVAGGNDRIVFHGKPRHVMGYLQDFLFSPERARSPVAQLSGGERNRLLLARLFAKPSNLLVLDEPTNDLDLETLELLEELLTDYPGTLLVVSHDREFLDNVVTSTLVLEGGGRVGDYAGGYEDWLRQRLPAKSSPAKSLPANSPDRDADGNSGSSGRAAATKKRPRGLTHKEQRELETLPATLETLETEQRELHEAMADPAFYQRGGTAIAAAKERLAALETELHEVYERWARLEEAKGAQTAANG